MKPLHPKRLRAPISVGVAALSALCLPTAVANAAPQPVTITIMTSWAAGQVPALPSIISSYEKIHPNVHIQLSYVSGSAAVEKLHAQFLSGNAPDIVQVFKKDFNGFVQAGYLTNLTSWAKSVGYYNNYFVKGALSYVSPLSQATASNPQIYGLDDYMLPSVFYYNKGVFQKYHLTPPSNLAQLLAVSKTLESHDVTPICIDAGDTDNNDIDILAKLVAQYAGAGELLKINNGTAAFTSPPMMKAAQVLGQLVTAGVLGKADAGANEAACQTLVASGKAAMESAHLGYLPAFTALEKSVKGFRFGVITNFLFTNNPVSEYSVTYGGEWVVPKTDKVLSQTEAFLKYMFSVRNATAEARETGFASDVAKANTQLSGLPKEVATGIQSKLTPQSLYMIDFISTEVQTTLGSGIQSLILGKINYKTLMEDAQHTQAEVANQNAL